MDPPIKMSLASPHIPPPPLLIGCGGAAAKANEFGLGTVETVHNPDAAGYVLATTFTSSPTERLCADTVVIVHSPPENSTVEIPPPTAAPTTPIMFTVSCGANP